MIRIGCSDRTRRVPVDPACGITCCGVEATMASRGWATTPDDIEADLVGDDV
jgi:hypothetical protein